MAQQQIVSIAQASRRNFRDSDVEHHVIVLPRSQRCESRCKSSMTPTAKEVVDRIGRNSMRRSGQNGVCTNWLTLLPLPPFVGQVSRQSCYFLKTLRPQDA
jgi:hypothetical protein